MEETVTDTTTDTVETDSDLSIGKIITIAAGLALSAVAVKQLVGFGRKKLAERRNVVITETAPEDIQSDEDN